MDQDSRLMRMALDLAEQARDLGEIPVGSIVAIDGEVAGSGHNSVSRDPEFGYAFLEEFQDRLFFGTDVCDPRNETPLPGFLDSAVEQGHITREAYEKIGWRNAEALLQL